VLVQYREDQTLITPIQTYSTITVYSLRHQGRDKNHSKAVKKASKLDATSNSFLDTFLTQNGCFFLRLLYPNPTIEKNSKKKTGENEYATFAIKFPQ
jgi:hypothetical protein